MIAEQLLRLNPQGMLSLLLKLDTNEGVQFLLLLCRTLL
jgi:hypothetical protein